MSDWRELAREYFKQDSIKSAESQGSLVDNILGAEEDPKVFIEPEDQFGLPKQLSTIAGLRKKGFNNARIFKAMELETAEQDKSFTPEAGPSLEEDSKPKSKPLLKNRKRS